jgi:CRISPR system Cascade subunit CasE
MFLSKLTVQAMSREAQKDLHDRYELHRTLMRAFPTELGAEERVMYRVEQAERSPYVVILVQSLDEPNWANDGRMNKVGYLATVPSVRYVQPHIRDGERLMFRLQANPTVKREGKRHAIFQHHALIAWLARKGEQGGFSVSEEDVIIAKLGKFYGKVRFGRGGQVWQAVQFDGKLTVTDENLFRKTLMHGVGSAKAFGFGLLSIPYRAIEG